MVDTLFFCVCLGGGELLLMGLRGGLITERQKIRRNAVKQSKCTFGELLKNLFNCCSFDILGV